MLRAREIVRPAIRFDGDEPEAARTRLARLVEDLASRAEHHGGWRAFAGGVGIQKVGEGRQLDWVVRGVVVAKYTRRAGHARGH